MATPQGPAYVEAALERIRSASDAIRQLGGIEENWRTDALARVASAEALLQATMDRFFLKTKVCLPFARKCEEEAEKLDVLLTELGVQPASDAQRQLAAALEALEKAARTLDERSLMQGMAIT